MWIYAKEALFCFFAALFFAILMKTPRKAMALCAVIATAGYMVFSLSRGLLHSADMGYFAGTLVMALLGETAARLLKMPSTVFISPAVIPLVPGVGLYQTMLFMAQGQLQPGLQTGAQTMLALAEMAMAIAISSFIFNKINRALSRRKAQKA